MSSPSVTTTAESPDAIQRPDGRRRWGWRWVLAGAVLVLIVGGVILAVTDPFASSGNVNGRVVDNAYPTSLATVTRRSLSSTMPETATLGYAGAYTVINRASGTYTRLPVPGEVITEGQSLYRVNAKPVVLLYGSTPPYRSLKHGTSGADVRQLNTDLAALGYGNPSTLRQAPNYFGKATSAAVMKLQADLGVAQSAALALGQVVFLPTAVRVTSIASGFGVSLGGLACSGPPACPGQPVLTASSTARQVTINLDATEQSYVQVGDRVTITLPNNTTTPGVISSISKVATVPSAASSSLSGSSPTVTVKVRPADPAATGTLDQAPVQVAITNATVHNALTVPLDALISRSSGRYSVEVVNREGVHHLVDVRLGIVDDADGRAQVSGSGLAAGQRVVVPGT